MNGASASEAIADGLSPAGSTLTSSAVFSPFTLVSLSEDAAMPVTSLNADGEDAASGLQRVPDGVIRVPRKRDRVSRPAPVTLPHRPVKDVVLRGECLGPGAVGGGPDRGGQEVCVVVGHGLRHPVGQMASHSAVPSVVGIGVAVCRAE